MDILDDVQQVAKRDTKGALALAGNAPGQLVADVAVAQLPKKLPHFDTIVVAGMGGSALAADMARDWLDLPLPFQVVKDYTLPKYVGSQTLVVVCSFSGNTEETLSALDDARSRGAAVVVASGGGRLLEIARSDTLPYIEMPYDGLTPRMFLLLNLRALLEILVAYKVLDASVRGELATVAEGLAGIDKVWGVQIPFGNNVAKQLAWHCAGKIPVVYAGARFRSVAYKWKIAFNETSKNLAFCHELSEFNHNEFIGWSSHPVDKPFAVLDIHSSFDHPKVEQRFAVSDRLLSGMRPKAVPVVLEGGSMLEQMVWGVILADYVSIYLAILNGVDPAPVELIEKLKRELAK